MLQSLDSLDICLLTSSSLTVKCSVTFMRTKSESRNVMVVSIPEDVTLQPGISVSAGKNPETQRFVYLQSF